MARTPQVNEVRDWCAGRMAIYDDWDGIAQERARNWESAVRQRQLEAQVIRPRTAWSRRVGVWLIYVGGWLMRLGVSMSGRDTSSRVSVPG